MKNFLIAALIIGLGVSLYFNFANHTAKPNENVRSFEIGKDSLQISLQIPADKLVSSNDTLSRRSFTTLQHPAGIDTHVPANITGTGKVICESSVKCDLMSLDAIQPPANIIIDNYVNKYMMVSDILRYCKIYFKIQAAK